MFPKCVLPKQIISMVYTFAGVPQVGDIYHSGSEFVKVEKVTKKRVRIKRCYSEMEVFGTEFHYTPLPKRQHWMKAKSVKCVYYNNSYLIGGEYRSWDGKVYIKKNCHYWHGSE